MTLLKNPSIKPVRHSERSEESRVFLDLRPFMEFTLSDGRRCFATLSMTASEGFRVTLKGRFSAESRYPAGPREQKVSGALQ